MSGHTCVLFCFLFLEIVCAQWRIPRYLYSHHTPYIPRTSGAMMYTKCFIEGCSGVEVGCCAMDLVYILYIYGRKVQSCILASVASY